MKRISALVMLALGCEVVATSPASPPEPPPAALPVEVNESALDRDVDPDVSAVQQALDAIVRVPAVILGRRVMTVRSSPFRDLIVFRAAGADYCRAFHPTPDCHATQGVTWDMREALGVALIEFDNPMAPRVMSYRFLGCPGGAPLSREPPGAVFDKDGLALYNQTSLESIEESDVDGDGHEEYVLIVWHTALGDEPERDFRVFELARHRHIFVLRDDLTFEADGMLHSELGGAIPGWAMTDDMLFETFAFRPPTDQQPAAIVVEWCEVDHYWDECSLDVLCPSSNRRTVIEYDSALDAFSKMTSEVLRHDDPDLVCE